MPKKPIINTTSESDKRFDSSAKDVLRGKSKRRKFANLLSFLGPAFIASVAYVDPAQEVVKSAINSNASVIVLGTHGKTGLNAFWSGSVAPKIVAKTLKPVHLYPVRRK